MSRTLFKFTKPPEGTTRRVMFMEQPGWPVLSAKLESLYGISKGNVGVSYIDSDGDEVTLSSDDELRDFYKYNNPTKGFGHSGDAMKAIRFTVRDLSAMRAAEEDKPLPHPPLSSNHRNTFGLSGAFEGDEWQHISAFNGPPTSLFVPMIPEDSPAPHAYLEVVESDVSMSRRSAQDDASSVTQSDRSTPKADKGKRRATVSSEDDEDDHASIVAMVEEDVPHKPPVHVRNASFAGTEDTFGVRKTAPPAPAVERPDMEIVDDPEDATMEIPDPPLADLEDIPSASHSNASLANDIAGLLNSFSNVFAAHPELSDAMRNIVRNASDGSYWSAQRDAVSRAAEGLRRDAQRSAEDMRSAAEEMHRAAEEAAGRRVAEALGSVVRAFGQFTGVTGIPDTTSRVTDEPITSTPVHHRTPGHHGSRPSRRFRRGTGLPGTENENVHARPPPRPDSLGSIHDPISQPSGDETKRDATQNDVGMAGPSRSRYTPDPQVVSNARGTFPRIEIQTVSPRRYNTMHITVSPRLCLFKCHILIHIFSQMGFTADKHANLPAKVSAHVHRMNDITSREAEDKAVADVVEELLAEPQPGASASGANLSRSQTMPGGLM
ncbi:hypothetical protein BDW22DRAFT_1321043 [Trametopsis cervina]|nr:hypothetical protein BDW22DRAFT_1321043 [Trametopsis cervina]